MTSALSSWKAPEIHVDPAPFKEIGRTVGSAIQYGSKLADTMTLSSFKMKTTLGRKLPEEDFPEVIKLVSRMHTNGWLSDEDLRWYTENVPQ